MWLESSVSTPKERKNMRWHAGSLVRILSADDEMNGEMTGVETIMRRGLEPPPHIHSHEDEAVLILSGVVEIMVGGVIKNPQPGEWIYMPRGVAHSIRVLSEEAHTMTMYTPSGLEQFFDMLSEPADCTQRSGRCLEQIPSSSLSYDNLFDMEYIAELGRQFGIKFLTGKPRTRAAAA